MNYMKFVRKMGCIKHNVSRETMLNEYKHDIHNLDSYSSSQFCMTLLVLLSKLE